MFLALFIGRANVAKIHHTPEGSQERRLDRLHPGKHDRATAARTCTVWGQPGPAAVVRIGLQRSFYGEIGWWGAWDLNPGPDGPEPCLLRVDEPFVQSRVHLDQGSRSRICSYSFLLRGDR